MMAEVVVSETNVPQDGMLRWQVDDRELNLRVSVVPFVLGEGIVIRILDRSAVRIGLDRLGMRDDHVSTLKRIAHSPNGLLFVTGPTGSGKTTTEYSIISEINSPGCKIMTIEDPVEFLIPGVNQAHVNRKAGFTFVSAIRSFMRHDPDVIMVGEIRDVETLQLCVGAAVTGHLVISTLHAYDVGRAIQRLRDMGTEDYLLGQSLVGIVAQRLVRKVCENCKREAPKETDSAELKGLGITAEDLQTHTLYEGAGCEQCRNTGYHIRTAIYEILEIDHEISALIGSGSSPDQIVEAASAKGFRSMLDDARRKVLDGITTPREALRVLAYSM